MSGHESGDKKKPKGTRLPGKAAFWRFGTETKRYDDEGGYRRTDDTIMGGSLFEDAGGHGGEGHKKAGCFTWAGVIGGVALAAMAVGHYGPKFADGSLRVVEASGPANAGDDARNESND